MTQTLANRMTTDTDQVFVACNPLQLQEEMLESNQMAETHGGVIPLLVAAKIAAPYVAGFVVGVATTVVGGYILHELTSDPGGCECNMTVNITANCG